MKLSEAIREGAKLRPQNFDWRMFKDGKSNALGAAYEFINKTAEFESNKFYGNVLKNLYWKKATCPVADCELHELLRLSGTTKSVLGVIVHLETEHKWTREQIADQLEKEGY